MPLIGFLINPVAGLGGTVGLKGSDGVAEKALMLGAVPRSGDRALLMLNQVRRKDILFFTCAGPMGEEILKKSRDIADKYHPPSCSGYNCCRYAGSVQAVSFGKRRSHRLLRR